MALAGIGCQTAHSPANLNLIDTALPAPLPHEPEPELTAVTVPDPLNIAAPAPLSDLSPGASAAAILTASGRPWPRDWDNAWVPLESWGKYNGFNKPVQIAAGPQAVYELHTTNGSMVLKMGSQMINIAGFQYGLGFAPKLISGFPYVHSLDARKTLQALSEALIPLPATNRTVVIDAGHGGRDSGTRSHDGAEIEKHYTLDWALRLGRLLASRGWKVVFTRTNDSEVALAERVAVADRAEANIFLSLHFNAAVGNRELSGVETYCLTPTGLPSSIVREYEDDPSEMHPNNLYDEHNVQLASRLHRAVVQSTGAVDRGVRRARFMTVLRGQHRPAVLIEGGYLSNPSEAKRVATPEYRQLLAEGVANALQ